MSQFEYLTVVVSLIAAFAISEILASWGKLIRYRRTVRVYWLHISWSALTLLLLIHILWGTWNYRALEFSFLQLLALVAPFLTIALGIFVITPDVSNTHAPDLREHYFGNKAWFFSIAAAVLVELALVDLYVSGQSLLHPENVVRFAAVPPLLLLARSSNERVHGAAVFILFGLFAVFIAFAFEPA
ncbi:MAG: hypothetical protein V3T33_10370 [Myxococcota bacterium]